MSLSRAKKPFPSTTLAQLLLLLLFVGLLMATWLDTKTSLEISPERPEVVVCQDAPLATIATSRRIVVIDAANGKTLLNLGPRDLPALATNAPRLQSAWYRWPDSASPFFTPNLDVDFRQGVFGSNFPADNAFFFWDMHRGSNPIPRCLFTDGGKAIAIEATPVGEQRFDFLVIDFASKKRTAISRPWKRFNYLEDQMEVRGDNVVLPLSKDKQFTIIEPATGLITASTEVPKRPEKSSALGLPLAVVDQDGIRGQIDSQFGASKLSLLLRRWEQNAPGTKLSAPQTLISWKHRPSIYWQSPKSSIWIHDGQSKSETALFSDSSPAWIVSDFAPFVRRVSWPFAEGETISDLRVTNDARGATATLRQPIDAVMRKESTIYWQFEPSRAASISGNSWKSQRWGDLLLVETPTHLQSVNLDTGKVILDRPLHSRSGPPLAMAWCIWLLAWTRWARPDTEKNAEKNALRLFGYLSTGLFLAAMAFANAKPSVELAWLLPTLLFSAGAALLAFLLIRKSAPIASLLVFGAISLALLASSLQMGFSTGPGATQAGYPNSTPAAILWTRITSDSVPARAFARRHLDYFTASWLGPRRIDYPGPHSVEEKAADALPRVPQFETPLSDE